MPSKCGLESCSMNVTKSSKGTQCEICKEWWHKDCSGLTEDEYKVLGSNKQGIHWFCRYCEKGATGLLDIIQKLTTDLKECREELEECKDSVGELKQQLLETRFNHDRLEQHGRKGSVRISGITDPKRNDENTDDAVLKVVNDCGLNLTKEDISVSHRLGGKDSTYDRPIIVKFVSRNSKRRLMMKKKELKEKPEYSDIFINEDITKNRYKLAKHLRVVENKVVWTRDGKILFKDNKDATQVNIIDTYKDLCKLNWDDKKLADIGIFQ